MKSIIIIIALFLFSFSAFSQQSDCKVNMPEISESYTGECRKGLAHGMGTARGVDYYEGHFVKGLPDGKGTYKWAQGNYYEGEWKKGLKEGYGKMVYGDSIVTGFWKKDKYQGEKLMAPYKITQSMNVSRATIKKSAGSVPGVRIRIMQGGIDNTVIEDLSIAYDSGQESRVGNDYFVQYVTFPLYVKVLFKTWNNLRTGKLNVIFEFTINEPGAWDVVINNN